VQSFDPQLYPHLCALDEKVKRLIASDEAKMWDTPRLDYEISRIHPVFWMEEYGFIRPGEVSLGDEADESTAAVSFVLNPTQLRIADRICQSFVGEKFGRIQLIVLKHRKAGVSMLTGLCGSTP
jgi:hypothetical protein